MNYNDNGICQAELQSMTVAQKAQRVLAAAAIPAEIIKLDSSRRKGCSYGIEFACNPKINVNYALSSAGITVKQWNRAD